jgi:SAM-dependent methyltransferase
MRVYQESDEIIRAWQWGDPAMRNLTDIVIRIAGRGPGKVMDVGCGSGRVAIALARSGFDVTGIDSEKKVIDIAGRIARDTGVRVDFRVMDLELTTGDLASGTYDLAVCCEVLEHVREPAHVVEHIKGLLKRGGRLILTVPKDPRQYTFLDDLGGHLRRFRREEVERLLGAFLVADYFTVGWPCMRSLVWIYTRIRKSGDHKQSDIWSGSSLKRLLINFVYALSKFDNLFNRLDLGTNMVYVAVKK